MARYDKYNGFTGGFRAFLAADWPQGTANPSDPLNPANWNLVVPVCLDANGAVTWGAAATFDNFVGVCIVSDNKIAGDVVDIMTHGEIVEFNDGKLAGVVAGQDWYADPATGLMTHTATASAANGFYVGHTVEPDRLIVRCQRAAVN